MSLLSLSVNYYGKPEIIRTVPPTDFWPAPAVDSAILRFSYERPTPSKESIEADKNFFRIARIGFAAKRKMLKNNLIGGLKISAESVEKAFQQAEIPSMIRAEALSVEEWRRLVAALSDFVL